MSAVYKVDQLEAMLIGSEHNILEAQLLDMVKVKEVILRVFTSQNQENDSSGFKPHKMASCPSMHK